MRPALVRRYPPFTLLRYTLAPNEAWTITTTGREATSFASFKLAGRRTVVENQDTGDDWADGSWQYDNDDPRCQRLYVGHYAPGTHVMEAGPAGMDFLCFLKVSPRPPALTHVEIDGDFTLPAGKAMFIASGTASVDDRVLGEFDYQPGLEVDAAVNGAADALLIDGPVW